MLCVSFHDLGHQVLVSIFGRVPRISKDAQFGNAGARLRVVTLRLAHRGHLPHELTCVRVFDASKSELVLGARTRLNSNL